MPPYVLISLSNYYHKVHPRGASELDVDHTIFLMTYDLTYVRSEFFFKKQEQQGIFPVFLLSICRSTEKIKMFVTL